MIGEEISHDVEGIYILRIQGEGLLHPCKGFLIAVQVMEDGCGMAQQIAVLRMFLKG
jgi:hypothetical protein